MDQKELRLLLVAALNESMYCKGDLQIPEFIIESVREDYLKIKKVAHDVNDPKLLSWSDYLLGGAYYSGGKYQKSLDLIIPVLDKNGEPKFLAEAYRAMILDYGYLHKVGQFKEAEKKIRDLMEKGVINDPLDIAGMFEGLGRSKAILKINTARDDLGIAEEIIKTNEENSFLKPTRNIQVLRSKLVAFDEIRKEEKGIDKDEAVEIATRGLRLAKLFGYARHLKEINKLAISLDITRKIDFDG